MTDANVEDRKYGILSKRESDITLMESETEGRQVTFSRTKTITYTRGETGKYLGISVDGKFIGFLDGWNFDMEFMEALPIMEGANPIPFTGSEVRKLVYGKSLGEFYQRYRYPTNVTIKGNTVTALFSEVYGSWVKKGRAGGLLLVAEMAEGSDAESAIVTRHWYTEVIGRQNMLDYIPFVGPALLDNFSPLKKYIRGIERQTFFDETKFEINLTELSTKAVHFILPESLHGGIVETIINTILSIICLIFMITIVVPPLFIPYMIVAAITMGNNSITNNGIHKLGTLAGIIVFCPIYFLFAITELPVVALLALVLAFFAGYAVINKLGVKLAWNRCEECVSWDSYYFTKYLKEGPWIKKTITRVTHRFRDTYSGGQKVRSEYMGSSSSTSTTTYRDVTKEYKCSECQALRTRDVREYK
jgi:hypothetical protein